MAVLMTFWVHLIYFLTRLPLRPTRRVECRIIVEVSARSSDAFGTTVKCILARQVVPRLPHGTSLLHGNSPSNLTQRHHQSTGLARRVYSSITSAQGRV